MKIAFVTPFYLPAPLSGSGVVVGQLAEELVQRGLDCSIITSQALNTRWWYDPIFGKRIDKEKESEIINGVRVYRLPCFQLLSFFALILVRYFKMFLPKTLFEKLQLFYSGPALIGLKELFQKEKFDLIYTSPLPLYLNWQVIKACENLLLRPKIILRSFFHGTLSEFQNPQLQKIFDKADLIHVGLKAEKEAVQKVFNVPEEKFLISPSFLSLERLKEAEELADEVLYFKGKHNLKEKKIILFAGNKIAEKGLYNIIKALDDLRERRPDYFLIIIGFDNPCWLKLKKKFRGDLFLDLNYLLEKEKETIFAACDVFCLPSICESFGLTYLEAWHKKKPVIGADIPTSRELILENQGGLLVKFGNQEELAETIEKLLETEKLSKNLGEKGYLALQEKYSSQRIIAEFEDFLKNFSEKKEKPPIVNPCFYGKEYYFSQEYAGVKEYQEGLKKLPNQLKIIYEKISLAENGEKFLDAGCGKGEMLYFMAKKGYEVFGIDYSKVAIALTKELLIKKSIRGQVFQADVRKTPFPDDFFDIVLSADVVEHLDNNKAVVDFLNEAYRILKPKGTLLIHTGPNKLRIEYFVKYYQRFVNFPIFVILNLLGKKEYRPTLEIRSKTEIASHINEQTYFSLRSSFQQSQFRRFDLEIVGDPLKLDFWKLPYYLLGYLYPFSKIFPLSIILGNHFYVKAQKRAK